ncbi:hypothetical protein PV10_08078 [Exophiala mesophila]|uniref:tRNA-splicing endonuclease subunit Sen15 domain-containing protein n=1 Tax=Exophiala mesophila TaxID=212818 RepID=A0A0D1Z0P9_EXOME|nr:uncharacterized protein PV10_08078 [Exophiala mesophila]KIV88392.1 hypothetical protein PV10_08078 [Exophiala mesophila]
MSSEPHDPLPSPQPLPSQAHPQPSALSTLLHTSGAKTPSEGLPLEILHNLRHQHDWTALKLHAVHMNGGKTSIHIISGLPPRHSYVHPDLTMQLVKHGMGESAIPVQREFVLPLAVGESWSLKRFCAVFDALPTRDAIVISPPSSGPGDDNPASAAATAATATAATVGLGVTTTTTTTTTTSPSVDAGERRRESSPLSTSTSADASQSHRPHSRPGPRQNNHLVSEGSSTGNGTAVTTPSSTVYHHQDHKRVLLGMKARTGGGGDSTVVYYIMQEGEVKPRQNG